MYTRNFHLQNTYIYVNYTSKLVDPKILRYLPIHLTTLVAIFVRELSVIELDNSGQLCSSVQLERCAGIARPVGSIETPCSCIFRNCSWLGLANV